MTEQMIGFSAIVGPIILLGFIFWLRSRARHDMQQTIRMALDKGHELSPELVDRLGHPKSSKDKDLRLGIIWLAVAVAFSLFALLLNEADAMGPLLGTAAFPGCIGVAYLLIWRFAGSD